MKKLIWLLLLASCGQNTAEQHPAVHQSASRPTVVARPPLLANPSIAYTSGDRITNGPHDTLHVGQSIVLRLEPGSKTDFPPLPRRWPIFSEEDVIRQQGNGRVRSIKHTLVVRPYAGPILRFTDNIQQMRHDQDELSDVECRFLGSLPGRPYWLADSALYEHSQSFLINKQSGQLIPLSYEPDISLNRKLLFVASPGLDSSASDNAIELWAISDQTVTPLWTRTLINWQPQRIIWLNNHTIAIEQLRFEPSEHTAYVRLILPN